MVEEILNLLEHQSLSRESLQERFNLTKNEIDIILFRLKKENLIYLDTHSKYTKVNSSNIIGRIESDSKNKKFVLFKNEKIFITPENLHTAMKNDLVVLEIYENNLGKVVGILERKNTNLVCEVISKKGKLVLVPFNTGCEVSLIADKKLLKGSIEGDRLVITLPENVDDLNHIIVKEFTKIGHKDDPKSDEIAIAISKGFDIEFSTKVINETLDIPNEVSEQDKIGRTDLTDETIFTIDSEHTKDMDDAISIKKLYNGNYLLGVHIADVAHYVKPHSELFKEALKRGTSLYLGDTVIPMIPHKLSNGICSLNEGVERLTKTVYMEINPRGKVKNYKIFDSVIKSKKKMTYEELNKLFNGEEVDISYAPFVYDLSIMRELSNILTSAKKVRGNIDFESVDLTVQNDEDENPLQFIERTNEEAEKIIENFMIMANETVATYFYWRDLPFIYRVHNLPDEIKLEKTVELIQAIGSKMIKLQNAYGQKAIQSILKKYEGTPEYSIISNLLLRNMSKAQYSTTNIGHFALALDNYCHFTSPIRRFPDLMIHHLLNIFNKDYSMNNLDKIEERLENVSNQSSYKERQADDAERDYIKLKMAKYMKDHVGEVFEGHIVDIDNESIIIKLDNNIKGIIAYTEDFSQAFYVDSYKKELKCKYSKTSAKLGTRVSIKVHEVNIPQKEVYFELIDLIKDVKLVRTKDNK